MKITLESTSKVVEVNGVPARVWEGRTESGIPLSALITRVAVDRAEDTRQFEAELEEHRPPRVDGPAEAFPMRMIL